MYVIMYIITININSSQYYYFRPCDFIKLKTIKINSCKYLKFKAVVLQLPKLFCFY